MKAGNLRSQMPHSSVFCPWSTQHNFSYPQATYTIVQVMLDLNHSALVIELGHEVTKPLLDMSQSTFFSSS